MCFRVVKAENPDLALQVICAFYNKPLLDKCFGFVEFCEERLGLQSTCCFPVECFNLQASVKLLLPCFPTGSVIHAFLAVSWPSFKGRDGKFIRDVP